MGLARQARSLRVEMDLVVQEFTRDEGHILAQPEGSGQDSTSGSAVAGRWGSWGKLCEKLPPSTFLGLCVPHL